MWAAVQHAGRGDPLCVEGRSASRKRSGEDPAGVTASPLAGAELWETEIQTCPLRPSGRYISQGENIEHTVPNNLLVWLSLLNI